MNSPEYPVPPFDVRVPHPARVYDYFLGGKDHYAADRAAADAITAAAPGVAASAQANRAFVCRAVRFLAAERGIRQFLDIGTGIPTRPSVHEVAQSAATESRVVYADNDRLVLRHAQALLVSAPGGSCDYIQADLRDPEKLLDAAGEFLDFTEPVALLLAAVLHFVPDEDNPAGIVAALGDALAPGSYLVLSHGTGDFHPPEAASAAANAYSAGPARLALRPRAAVEAFFDGFELVPPGLVQAHEWEPDPAGLPYLEYAQSTGVYAGVGVRG